MRKTLTMRPWFVKVAASNNTPAVTPLDDASGAESTLSTWQGEGRAGASPLSTSVDPTRVEVDASSPAMSEGVALPPRSDDLSSGRRTTLRLPVEGRKPARSPPDRPPLRRGSGRRDH
jgi:hypothetical protein